MLIRTLCCALIGLWQGRRQDPVFWAEVSAVPIVTSALFGPYVVLVAVIEIISNVEADSGSPFYIAGLLGLLVLARRIVFVAARSLQTSRYLVSETPFQRWAVVSLSILLVMLSLYLCFSMYGLLSDV